MGIDKKREFIINTIYTLIVIAIIYITIKYVVIWFLPFVIGFGIAFMLKPSINFITKKVKINRKIVAGLTVLIFYTTVGALFSLLVVKVSIGIKDIFTNLPNIYNDSIQPVIIKMSNNFENALIRIDPALMESINEMTSSFVESIGTVISGISTGVVSFISSAVAIVPSFFIIVIFSIISTFFFAMDYFNITSFIVRQFPNKYKRLLFEVKDYIVGTLFKIVKAYAIIMDITFIELAIGLFILRVQNPISIAFLIAIVDILPILGTGGVMIPWILIEVFKENISLAIGLTILYIFITIVRNIIEPKIVGEQIGLNPLIMLICIFVGVKLFGFLGLFILPIIVIIIKNLNDSGKIKIIK